MAAITSEDRFEQEMETYDSKIPQLICPICYSYEDRIKKASFESLGPYCFPACSKEHMVAAFQYNIPLPYKYYNKNNVIAPRYVWVSPK